MGPLFVLLFWIAIGSILSVLGGLLLMGGVGLMLRGIETGRKRATVIAGILPAAGFAYLFGCVLLFSLWSSARGRDWGWGDTWDTPVLGGYHVMMIDVTDLGKVYKPEDSGISGGIVGVRRLEVRPPYLIGTASPDAITEYPIKSPEALFFILDTRNGGRTDEPSMAALESAAEKLGGPLNLRPINDVYNRYRYEWIDLIPVTVFAVPPLIVLVLLARALVRLKVTRQTSAQSHS